MQKKIIICGLADIQKCVEKFSPDKMLTIINKNFEPETPSGMDKNRHLKMLIDDISEPREGFILPQKHHAQALLDFTNDWDTTKPLLVHCHMGISRSTSTSLGVAAKYDPDNIKSLVRKVIAQNSYLEKVFEGDLKSWPLYFTPQILPSTNSKVFYIGDAFNGFLPTLAQGAGQSIESAYELFNLINEDKEDIQNAYYQERLRRAKIVRRRSNINFFVFI